MTYEVINLETGKSHGEYESIDEARGCIAYDDLYYYAIWRGNTCVESRDSGMREW